VYAEGAVFSSGEPRLTKLSGFIVEARLDGTMVVFTNNDKPGVIGAIGTFLGGKQVNIASFELSRMELGGKAMAIINVDSTPSPDDLAEMKKIVNVLDVKLVQL
jgi:D-3-phosphoglycerate dehydrogenase